MKSRKLIVLTLGIAGLAGGCNREEPVAVQQVPKEPPKMMPPHGQSPHGAMPAAGRAKADEGIQWTVPAGWKSMPAGQMRYAVFAVSEGEPQVLLTVIPLPPQPLLPNVNRWEQQIGLPPTPEAELGKVCTRIDVNGVAVDMIDLKGPEKTADGSPPQRMLAAMLTHAGKTWFFKMVGPAEKVGPQKANFDAFMRSIRFSAVEQGKTGSAAASPRGPMPAGHPEIQLAGWDTPQGWQQAGPVQPPRVLAFTMGSGAATAEMVLTRFPGSSVGSLESNINRWRGQLGMEPATDMSAYAPRKVKVAGGEAPMFEIVAPESAGASRKGMLVAMAAMGDESWVFKLMGPADEVARQKPAFESFLKSVRFVGQAGK